MVQNFDYVKENDHCIERISYHTEKLSQSDNNKKYITALKWMQFWMQRLSNNAHHALQMKVCKEVWPENNMHYLTTFYTGDYDRVNNSILEYEYGARPF